MQIGMNDTTRNPNYTINLIGQTNGRKEKTGVSSKPDTTKYISYLVTVNIKNMSLTHARTHACFTQKRRL